MRAIFLFFICLILGINSAYSYELVLPKEKKTTVKTKYAFFVGAAKPNESIVINDEKVFVASNGAFAHSIKLKDGENRIVVKSDYSTQIYRVIKEAKTESIKCELKDLEPRLYKVNKNNVPLRKTPVDFGMNRLSHLFKGTYLLVNGEQGSFYRVVLSRDKEAWIDKTYVEETTDVIIPTFVSADSETYKNATKRLIEFTENLPYTIEEVNDEIVFKVYNPLVSLDSVFTFNIRKPEKYFYTTNLMNGLYEFKVSVLPNAESGTLESFNIAIDAGHGGFEKGALGCLGDKEKDINLKIALELKSLLESMGANVIMTRSFDRDVSLDERVKIAKDNDAQIFVSIHLNSIPDIKMDVHKNRGTSVYYYNENSKDLAQKIEKSVVEKLGTRNDGVKTASFAVIRPTEYIGVLVETAYMTNPIDSVLYTREDFEENAAKAIADGILEYVNSSL